jgi:hypothetical protein
MKRAILILAAGALAVGFLVARAESQAKTATSIEKLKTLVGDWSATSPAGEPFTNKIRLVSNGTTIEETFQAPEHDQMVTMYTPDGNRVSLTHYCSMGNQPRMETPVMTPDGAIFEFTFTGATNLPDAKEPHMHHMVLRVADSDHFSETWTMQVNGKDQAETFQFTRKKA